MPASARSSYDLEPTIQVRGHESEAFEGAPDIVAALADAARGASLLVVECYLGVFDEAFDLVQAAFCPDVVVRSEDAFFGGDELTARMQPHLTDDRVRGVMYYGPMEDFLDPRAFGEARERVREARARGLRVLVYGVGATLVAPQGDLLVYCDLARWQIQLRYRAGMPNFRANNAHEDPLRKVKRGYFVEWRIADRRKVEVFDRVDWFLDTNAAGRPRLVAGDALRDGLAQAARQPFRLVPYFDPGVWGGHWMQERFGLDPSQPNYAWSFDGVPEENSLYLRFGDVRVEVPAMDLTLSHPRELLGEKVYARFGAEFPIRFDFLDTMGGGNLSLQVHPTTQFIREQFGMPYTQDESYYLLDAQPDAVVYLGLKKGVDRVRMIEDLRAAQRGELVFDAEKYVNKIPAKKHDHYLIPGGTIHCSGAGSMVLEISSTPNIFTFKLWDWGRLGLDGKPRPINVERGSRVIQWERDTDYVKAHLANHFSDVAEGEGWKEIKTGLHPNEFIETRRTSFSVPVTFRTENSVHVLNLVEGEEAVVESPDGRFEPFVVHYAETFIIPASVEEYTVRPCGLSEGKTCMTIRASVRFNA